MRDKIRNWLIRRLGCVPIARAGVNPLPGWYLMPEETTIEQSCDGIFVTTRFRAFDPREYRMEGKA